MQIWRSGARAGATWLPGETRHTSGAVFPGGLVAGEYGYRNLPEFLDIIREVTHQGLIDIMLMSAYVNEQLTIKEGLFQKSHVTPAARANDTTDVWACARLLHARTVAAVPFGEH